jgi:ABC-type antimicrobial peptide transport system permease subunit
MTIKQLVFRKVNKLQLRIVTLGAVVGFLFVFVVIHYFGEINNLTKGQESLGANLVVAQKKVTKYSSFNETSNLFTADELSILQKHKAIKRLEPVINNQFYVSLAMREEGLPYFRTDIFIQSVSNDLLDVDINDWKWNENTKFVPLIMPRDFMLMLNQFAASYKIPQVSEDIAKTLNFTLSIRGKGQNQSVNARIVGFSNQMNAVLVPEQFMSYGNTKFASSDSIPVSQLVLQLDEKQFSDFEQVAEELNLEIKENELLLVKIQGMLYAVLSALLFVALLIVLLCGMLILQFSMLLISDSAYEIQTLLRLGYYPKQIARLFFKYFLMRFLLIILFTIPVFFIVKFFINKSMIQYGLLVSEPLSLELSTLLGFCSITFLALLITVLNYVTVLTKMSKAAKG